MQKLRVTVISDTSIAVSWIEPLEAREAIVGYEVELRHYIQKSVGTAEATLLRNFALSAEETNIIVDSLSK